MVWKITDLSYFLNEKNYYIVDVKIFLNKSKQQQAI